MENETIEVPETPKVAFNYKEKTYEVVVGAVIGIVLTQLVPFIVVKAVNRYRRPKLTVVVPIVEPTE